MPSFTPPSLSRDECVALLALLPPAAYGAERPAGSGCTDTNWALANTAVYRIQAAVETSA